MALVTFHVLFVAKSLRPLIKPNTTMRPSMDNSWVSISVNYAITSVKPSMLLNVITLGIIECHRIIE